jgi:protocatechuate 3,4-dioxygenase beta subunit
MKNLSTAVLAVILIFTLAWSMNAATVQSDGGAVQGVVTRGGTTEGIAGVKITLSGGPVDAISLRALAIAGQSVGFYIPQNGQVPNAPAALAPNAPAPPTPPQRLEEDRLLQMVMDSATSQGLSPGSAALTVALNNYRDQTAKFKTVTDSGGRFSLNGIPPGRYTVRAERDGYFDAHNAVATVDIAGNQPVAVALSMIPGATVGGNIRDEDGDPVANATVQIYSVIYPNGFPTLGAAVTTKTNFRGDYRLFWMAAGDYIIGASLEVYATQGARTFYPGTPDLTSAAPISLKTGENIDRINFQLKNPRMVRVSGEVISSAPPPPPPTIPAGVQLSPAQQAALASTTRNVALLGLLSRNPDIPDASDNPEVATVSLNANRGEFSFSAPPGAYELAGIVFSGGFGKMALDIVDRDLIGVTLGILPPVTLTGKISIDGPAIDFSKLRIVTLPDNRLNAELGNINIGPGPGAQRLIAPDGTFSLPVNGGNRVHLTVVALPTGVYLTDIQQDGASVYDSGFDIVAETHPVQIVLKADGATVKGRIVSPSGKPVSNAAVVLVPPEGRRQNRALFRVVNTDSNGNFTHSGVAPGEYKVFAWIAGMPGGSYYNSKFLSRYEDRGRPITVSPGATVNVDPMAIPTD